MEILSVSDDVLDAMQLSSDVDDVDVRDDDDDVAPTAKRARSLVNYKYGLVDVRDADQPQSPFVFLVAEVRTLIADLLPVPALGALANTCHSFCHQLARLTNGPLYYPAHWRKHVARKQTENLFANYAFGRALQWFLVSKAKANVFYGLQPAACSRVRLTIGATGGYYTFLVADAFSFKWSVVECVVPEKKAVDQVKSETSAAVATARERTRRLNHVPKALRNQRATQKSALGELRASMKVYVRTLQYDFARQSLHSTVAKARTFLSNVERAVELEASLHKVEVAIEKAIDAAPENQSKKRKRED